MAAMTRGAVLALVALVLATYAPGLANDLIYDDLDVIVAQSAPESARDVARLFAEPHFRGLPYYRPVVRTTLLVQKAWHGDAPLPFHAANLALAAAAGLLAYAILRQPGFGARPLPALLAAGLLAAHPATSSCVYPVASGRETLLPGVLVLAAVLAHLRAGAAARSAAFLAFVAALFAKEQSIVLPPLFVLADALRLGADPPGPSPRRWLLRYAPLALAVAGYLAVRQALFAGGEWRLAVLDAPLGPLFSLAYAVQTAFAPFVALAYEPETAVWWSPPRLALAAAAAAALALALARAGAVRAAAFLAGWFLLTLLPTAQLLRQEAAYDERYVFLALFAPCAALALVLSRARLGPRARALAFRLATLALCAASLTSFGRAATFRDDETFARAWLRTNPRAPEPHLALGLVRAEAGDVGAAIPLLRQAVALEPGFVDAWVNLGVALAGAGRRDEARGAFERALALRPDHPEALANLGFVLAAEGRLDDAVRHYRASIRLDPRAAETWNNLGTALARLGDAPGADAALREALRLRPGYEDAARNLARLRRETPPAP
jgi:Flp pilus assembly protein TadD